MIALVAQSWEKTSLTACVNGSISLRGDDWSRFADELSFQTRDKDGHWSMIGSCSSTQGCTTLTPVLKDGTKLWIGSNRTLFVNHTAGNLRNATQQLHFLLVDTDSGRRHIYVVNLVHCKLLRFFFNLFAVIECRENLRVECMVESDFGGITLDFNIFSFDLYFVFLGGSVL